MSHIYIKSGNVVIFRGVRWWADNGLICSEKVDGSDYKTDYVRDILLRLNAFSQMIGNSRTDEGIATHATEVQEYLNYIENMISLCKQAQDQGRPDDPKARQQKLEEFKAARGRRIVTPGLSF